MEESAQGPKPELEPMAAPRKKTLWRRYGYEVPTVVRFIQCIVGFWGTALLALAILAVIVTLVRGDALGALGVAARGILGFLLIWVAALIATRPFLGTLTAAILQSLWFLIGVLLLDPRDRGPAFIVAIPFTVILWLATLAAWRFERRQAGLLERSRRKRQKP